MTFFNETPLAAELFEQANMRGRMNGVIGVRGAFVAHPDRRLVPADTQASFVWEDRYTGNPLETPLVAVGDLTPFKPGTDVTFLGSSFSPNHRAERTWDCSLEVARRLKKTLRVTGSRYWEPRERGWLAAATWKPTLDWVLSDPEPAYETPICWSQAFGGGYAASDALDAERFNHPDNWIGIGWINDRRASSHTPQPAPRIENPDDPIRTWRRDDHVPWGLSPIPPFWNVRRKHAGTVDEKWIAERHPLLPEDFDYRFWQCAPPECVAEPWLSGHEVITLTNLHRHHPVLRVALPGVDLRARLVRPGRAVETHPVVLDGVHFDFRGETDNVFLTWRCGFPWPDGSGDVILDGGVHGR